MTTFSSSRDASGNAMVIASGSTADTANVGISPTLPNGVRLERHHCIQLRLSSNNIVKLSDWDIKQSIRKLDAECSTPLYERLDRCPHEKILLFVIIYRSEASAEKLTSKISLLRNSVKIGLDILHVEIKHESKNFDESMDSLQQVMWLRNLPIRWFELDLLQGSCVVPMSHVLWKYLDNSFGRIVGMETKSPETSNSALLQCDVCVKFADESSCKKIMNEMSSGSCVASKEGASIVFQIVGDLESGGYMDSKLVAERKTLRDKIRAAKLQHEADIILLTSSVNEAEEYLESVALDATDALSASNVSKERESFVDNCKRCKLLIKQSESSRDSGRDLDEIIDLTKSDSKALKAAIAALTRMKTSFSQTIAVGHLNKKLAVQREAEKQLQIVLHDSKKTAHSYVTKAAEMCGVIRRTSSDTDCTEVFEDTLRRTEMLTATLTRLLQTETGGQRYAQTLQKSLSLMQHQIENLIPTTLMLTAFATLVESMNKSEADLTTLRGSAPSLFPSHPTDMAELSVRSLVKHGRDKFQIFLKNIKVKNSGAVSVEESERAGADECDAQESEGEGAGDSGVDMLDIVESLELHIKVCETTLAAELLASVYLPSAKEQAGTNDLTQILGSRDGMKDCPSVSITEQCVCHTDCCICDSAEMRQLSNLFRIEILQPYQDRIKRIAMLLQSPLPTLLDTLHSGDVRRSVENAYDLLQVGIHDFEGDKIELRNEAKRIHQEHIHETKQKKIAEEKRIEHEKNERKKLLERKIALLKTRKRELEEAEERRNDEIAFVAAEELRRKREYSVSENARLQDDSYNECENGDFTDTDLYRHDSSQRYTGSRYSDGREYERQPRRSECTRGAFVYALQPPCWDMQSIEQNYTDNGNTATYSDRATTTTAVPGECVVEGRKRNRILSAVGWNGKEDDSGIVSATRRKLSQGGVTLRGAESALTPAEPANLHVAEECVSVTNCTTNVSDIDSGITVAPAATSVTSVDGSSSVEGIIDPSHIVVAATALVLGVAPEPVQRSVVEVAASGRKEKKGKGSMNNEVVANTNITLQSAAPSVVPATVAAAVVVPVIEVEAAVEVAVPTLDTKKQESFMREALLASKLKRKKLLKCT